MLTVLLAGGGKRRYIKVIAIIILLLESLLPEGELRIIMLCIKSIPLFYSMKSLIDIKYDI